MILHINRKVTFLLYYVLNYLFLIQFCSHDQVFCLFALVVQYCRGGVPSENIQVIFKKW